MKNFDDIFDFEKPGRRPAPFDVPAGYFEQLDDRIEARIHAATETPDTRRTIIRVLKPVLGLAASFLLVMLLVKYPLRMITPQQTASQQLAANHDDSYLRDLLLDNPAGFDDQALVQTITTDPRQPADTDALLSILTDQMNDYEIFAALTN